MADNQFSRFIFNHQAGARRFVKILSLAISFFSIGLIIYFYGFPQNAKSERTFVKVFEGIFTFYVLSFVIRLVFNLNRIQFIKSNWFEGILMVFLVYDVISMYLFGVPILENSFKSLGVENFTLVYILFIQVYLLLFVGIDTIKLSSYLARFKLKTPIVFGLSFVALILVGSGLLMMPEMTIMAGSMDFWDALFTSVSASCVTGLAVVDTATFFTFKGQLVILLLFQIGGIGIITFALFFALFLRAGAGLQSQQTVKEMLNASNLAQSKNLLKQVVVLTLVLEAGSAFFIYTLIGDVFPETGDRLFNAIFHAVSAFCNAGFSLFSDGLYDEVVRHKYVLHIVIAGTIFFGSLGFPAIQDLFGPKKLRERMKYRWKDWHISTKIALYSSVIIVLFGAVVIFFLEKDNTLSQESSFGMITGAFFQSVTTRTAGFNTVDFGMLATPTLIIMMLFMFIGASSASTGGGIKTSTFVVLFLAAIATIRNQKEIQVGKRSISTELLNKAFTIFVFAATYVFISVFLITITDPEKDVVDLTFEVISAFCTVGLSTGITSDMSFWGKVILMVSMYLGRVGILTLVVSLSRKISTSYKYPRAHVMIG